LPCNAGLGVTRLYHLFVVLASLERHNGKLNIPPPSEVGVLRKRQHLAGMSLFVCCDSVRTIWTWHMSDSVHGCRDSFFIYTSSIAPRRSTRKNYGLCSENLTGESSRQFQFGFIVSAHAWHAQ